MAIPCIGRMNNGSLGSGHAFRQYRGVHHRGRRRFRSCRRLHHRRCPHRPRRLPSGARRAGLPPDELRALPRGRRHLRAPLLHPGPAPAGLRGLWGERGRGELDGVGRDRRAGAVRPADERAVGAFRTAYVDDGVPGGGGHRRSPGPLRTVDRRAGGAAGRAGRGARRASGLGDGVSGGGGPPQGADHRDRPVRRGQQRRRDERPGHHRVGRAGVGLAGGRRHHRADRRGLRGGLPAAAPGAAALRAGFAAATGAGPHRARPSGEPAAVAGCTRSARCS